MPKLAIKMGQLARLLEAMRHGLTRVAIDCTLEEAMTDFVCVCTAIGLGSDMAHYAQHHLARN